MSEPLRGPAAVFEQMWQSSEKECAELRAEIERLRAYLDHAVADVAHLRKATISDRQQLTEAAAFLDVMADRLLFDEPAELANRAADCRTMAKKLRGET